MRLSVALRTLLILPVMLTLVVRPALADLWYESYKKANEALAAEDWSEAIAQINAALENKGNSGARARTFGMNFTDYFPYYKLGIAYYNLGQLDAALQAFDTEERLGAIKEIEDDYSQLQQLRDVIRREKEDAVAEEQKRKQQIVAETLTDAQKLEQDGRFEDALNVLGKALALAPENDDVTGMRERLLASITRGQQAADLANRAAELVEQGKKELDSNRYQEAASTFNQALNLKPSNEIRSLLLEAQNKLREKLGAEQDALSRMARIDDGLKKAGQLESAGDIVSALDELQSVLALDPDNREATTLQARLLRAQAASEQENAKRETVRRLLADAKARFDAGEFQLALAAASRALDQDAGSDVAKGLIASTYRELNRVLLGTGPRQNLPPAIRWASPTTEELPDGLRVELVRNPDYLLSGMIVDDAAVELIVEHRFYTVYETADRIPKEKSRIEGSVDSQQFADLNISQFRFDQSLRPGLSVFQLRVVDAGGLVSTGEHAVVYVRPFVRSPLLYSGLAVGLVLGASVVYGRRVRRRNQLVKRRFNPYIAGAPVLQDKAFFGRERLLNRVLQTIHNNSILLYGERRIGKTSLQHRLMKRLLEMKDPKYTFYPVYIDLQGTPQEKFFATLAEDIFQELAPMLDGCKPNPAIANGSDYQYRELVGDVRAVLKILAKKSDKNVKLVLLIDEVDELNAYDPRINQRLRSLFMKSFAENLVAVVSGVAIKKHWESEGSPWYNFFEEVQVKPFRREDARELIERPIHGIFKLDNGVVDAVIGLTDCKPYLIQKLCVALINRLHEERRRRITVADVEAIGRPKEA